MSTATLRPPKQHGGRKHIRPLNVTLPAGWGACPTCPPDDNVWPLSAFRARERAGEGARPKVPICGACLYDRYTRVHKPCATCGMPMHNGRRRHHVEFPQCLTCMQSGIPTCARCKCDVRGRSVVGELCIGCHTRGGELPQERAA